MVAVMFAQTHRICLATFRAAQVVQTDTMTPADLEEST